MSLRVFEELRESCTEVIFAFQRRHLVVETSFSGLNRWRRCCRSDGATDNGDARVKLKTPGLIGAGERGKDSGGFV